MSSDTAREAPQGPSPFNPQLHGQPLQSQELQDPPIRSVLMVCTGNICRSPYAHLRLQALVPEIEVASAGIGALVGSEMEPQMAALLRRHRITADGFSARQVDRAVLDADLVLTMSHRQRAYLIDEHPGAARRIGLLGAVPDLLASLDGSVPTRSAVDAWTRRRVSRSVDVPDPYRRSPEVAREVADQLDRAVEALAGAFTG